ncbi:MAG: GNAT family N-acetyltransferase [Roseburia sp.]
MRENLEKDFAKKAEKRMGECHNLEEEIFVKKLNKDLSYYRAGECLLVSGDAVELQEAARLGMAALGYLPAGPSGVVLEETSAHSQNTVQIVEEDVAQNLDVNSQTPPADMYAEGFDEVDLVFLRRVYERHHYIPWTILVTKRCIVKEFSMDYLDDLFSLYAGEGMTDYIEPLYPYEQEREYQQAYIENMYRFYGYGMWIVCERETGKLIGRVGVECREELGGALELGYVVGVPYQRKGYATEVCLAILDYAKMEIGAGSICCLIETGNVVSEALAEKLGFVYSTTLALDGKRMKKYMRDLS